MSTNEYLPEAAINADPAGAWESGDVADGETAQRNAEAAGAVEGAEATQGADPDLVADADLDDADQA